MPVVERAVGHRIDRNHPRRTAIVLPIEKQQLHAVGAAGEQAEVDTSPHHCSAQGMAPAGSLNRFRSRRLDLFPCVPFDDTHESSPAHQLLGEQNHAVWLETKLSLEFL